MRILVFILAFIGCTCAHAQVYTFECQSGSRFTGDSCDICPSSVIRSRSFNGLAIYRDGNYYRWLDQPYSIRVKPGNLVEYWEHGANPYSERITIPLALTGFSTVQGMADSTWCNFTAPDRAQNLDLDSIDVITARLKLSQDDTPVYFREGTAVNFTYEADTMTINVDTTGLGGGGGGSVVANNGVSDNENGGDIRLGNRYMGSPYAPFTMNRKLNIDGRFFYLGDLSDSTMLVADGSSDRIGIGTDLPTRKADVNGEFRVRDLTTTAATVLVGADADGVFSSLGLGSNLQISGGNLTIIGLSYQGLRDDGTDMTKRAHVNFVASGRVSTTLTDDLGNNETEVLLDVIDGSISTVKIADAAVTTAKIADANVTTAKIADNAVTTAKINNAAVTYAKIQNAAANNVFLGNNNGAGTPYEELNKAAAQTLLGLTGTINRFALWTAADNIGSDAAFTFDAVNDRATFTGSVAGVGANAGILNLNSGAIAGATTFLRCSGNINGNMIAEVVNSNNTNAANHTILTLSSGGAASGDALTQYNIAGVITHSIGIDNTDDRLKLTPNSATPGGNAAMGVIIRDNAGTGNTGINNDFPTHPLTVEGRTRSDLFMGEGNLYTAGNVAFGNGAGTGPTLGGIVGTGNGFYISFTTGTTPTNNGVIFTLTYPTAFITRSFVTFSAGGDGAGVGGDNAAADYNKFKISASGANSFEFKAVGTLAASTAYFITFNFWGY